MTWKVVVKKIRGSTRSRCKRKKQEGVPVPSGETKNGGWDPDRVFSPRWSRDLFVSVFLH